MNTDIIKTDVTVIKFYKNYILAGIGNYLHIYQRCNLLLLFKKEMFDGQKIHSINCENKPLIIFGGRELCTFTLHLQEEYNVDKFIHNLQNIQYDDWILDAIIHRNEIITISAHNVVIIKDLKDNNIKWEKPCDVNSILYGATIAKKNNELFILAGTVFSEILIWSPNVSSSVLYRLTGHEGVIFSITWNEKKNIICSTSDDRTVRLWKVNFNLNNENKEPAQAIEIKPKIVMYGHTARVMRAKILSDCIISIGEDSLINIWNHNGGHLRKIESHQNDCIWSLDCDETYNQLITGGGDSGICLHSIKEDMRKNVIVCPSNDEKNAFKKTCFLNESNLIIITELGTLYHFNCNSGIKIVAEIKGFQKILLEVSPDRVHVAVVGAANVIFIYHLIKCELTEKKTIKIDTSDTILSLHWLNGSNILICDSLGQLRVGNIEDGIFNICGILPKTKERWTTAACKHKQFIIVGDRGGNIHLFDEFNNLHQTLSKVHGRLGIPCLKIINSILITTGRDGMVKKFKINENLNKLEIYSSTKIPFKWCANVIQNQSLVIGFLEFNFVIWSMNLHRKIFEYNCGGGHRSWDLYILDKNHFKFIYIKDKYVHEITVSTDSFRNLEQGFHSHEINTIIPVLFENNLISVSGGEDTTLRISRYTKSNFSIISTHNFHLSSIRCLYSNQLTENETLIYSAGGRAQLVLSKLVYENSSIEFDTILSQSLKINNQKFDPETRIMDVISFQSDDMNFLIFIACSDGNLRVFRYKYKENNLNFIYSSNFHNCCITKLGILRTDKLVLLSMGTNGKILFWDFSFLLDSDIPQNVNPFFVMKIHQSAINSFSYKQYDENIFLLATGGDDCKLNLSLIELFDDVKVLSSWNTDKYFCSQVTGIIIIDQFLFACSTDQRVTICELIVVDKKYVDCKFVTQKCSTISDLLGLCNFTTADVDDYAICVYGKGIEVFRFNKNSPILS